VKISYVPVNNCEAHNCLQTTVLQGCIFENGDDMNMLHMNTFYTKFDVKTKHILRLRVCSKSITVLLGNWITPTYSLTWVSSALRPQNLEWYRLGHCHGPVSAT
jgi:hypothetical protein